MSTKKPSLSHLPIAFGMPWNDCGFLVEQLPDYAIFLLDAEGRVATWNAGAERIEGYKSPEIIGTHCSKFYCEEDVAKGTPQLELDTASKLGRTVDHGWRIRKDGSRFWASVTTTALKDEAGSIRGFGKLTRDMSANHAVDQRLQQADQRFHHLVDAVIDYAIFMLDERGYITSWNSGATRVKGYTASEIIGTHFSVFYTPEDRAAGKPDAILQKVRSEGRYEDESWRVRKGGTRFWANVVITALRDHHGTLTGFAKVTRDLTDRKLTEEALRHSEERVRLLVENIPDYAIYMLDEQGLVTTWNHGAERMKGYAASEIIGKNFAAFFPERDVAEGKPKRELDAARQYGRFEDEGWRVRKDGSKFWVNAIITALRDAQGKLIGFAKITRDLTVRRHAEETARELFCEQAAREAAEAASRRLQDSEERYRGLSERLEVILEGVADGITVQDRSGRLVFANTAAARICGYASGTELVNSPEASARFEILDEEGGAVQLEDLPGRRALGGEPSCTRLLHVRQLKAGRSCWALVKTTAVQTPGDAAGLAVNIWHDVSAERREELQTKYLADASSALASSLKYEEMLSRLSHVLVPGLADWCTIYLLEKGQLESVVVTHADAAKVAAAKEYQAQDLSHGDCESGIWTVLHTGQPEMYQETTDSIQEAAARDPARLAILRSLGIKSALVVPLRARDRILGVLLLGSAECERRYDTSDLALAVELGSRAGAAIENSRLYARAQEAAKAAEEASRAKDEFLATVSHELRTPLNAILGWAALLSERGLEPEVANAVSVIFRNAQAQVKIIDDILDVSRVITGKFRIEPKPVNLVAIARDAIEVVRPSAVAKRIDIQFSPAKDMCLLVADAERLQQVVWNLLSNAVKFTEPGGKIALSVRQDGSTLVLSVSDTGRGIDPSFLSHVFERFKQADSSTTRKFGGLGLGLALVRHITELHGGQVTAASEGVGKGSTFTISLPVRALAPPAEPWQTREPREPFTVDTTLLSGVRVLVLDDERDARELISTVLTSVGADVQTAATAQEAFDLFRRSPPDVLVSDIGMPEEDGLSFIRRIRALSPVEGGRAPALALTAFTREEDRTLALSSGYTTHIGKPVSPKALTAAVANLASVNRSGSP